MKKYKQKEVTMSEYQLIIDKIIEKQQEVHDTLIELLEAAANCKIVEKKRKK